MTTITVGPGLSVMNTGTLDNPSFYINIEKIHLGSIQENYNYGNESVLACLHGGSVRYIDFDDLLKRSEYLRYVISNIPEFISGFDLKMRQENEALDVLYDQVIEKLTEYLVTRKLYVDKSK